MDSERPLAPYLMEAEEAWGLAQRLGLTSCFEAPPAGGDGNGDGSGGATELLLQAGWVADPLAVGPLACVANAYRAALVARQSVWLRNDKGECIPVQASAA